jgi:hypothetical protein
MAIVSWLLLSPSPSIPFPASTHLSQLCSQLLRRGLHLLAIPTHHRLCPVHKMNALIIRALDGLLLPDIGALVVGYLPPCSNCGVLFRHQSTCGDCRAQLCDSCRVSCKCPHMGCIAYSCHACVAAKGFNDVCAGGNCTNCNNVPVWRQFVCGGCRDFFHLCKRVNVKVAERPPPEKKVVVVVAGRGTKNAASSSWSFVNKKRRV